MGSGLPETTTDVVATVAQHRALSTEQVRLIHYPEGGTRWAQEVLARIEAAGFLAHVDVRLTPRRLWFATEAGVRLARAGEVLSERPRLFSAEEIGGRLWAHTHAVNDAAIDFLLAARERGDDFGPLSWHHEVFHQAGPKGAPNRRRLIADAVLTYVRGFEDGEVFLEQRFLEVDRATRSIEGTAGALAGYAHLAAAGEGGGGWKALYPSLPPVICVLDGAAEKALLRRRTTILALLRARPEVSRAEELRISICLASELAERGPFAPIFGELREPGKKVDWLGRSGR